MSQPKKHPLEVFRAAQQSLGGRGPSGRGSDGGDDGSGGSGGEPPDHGDPVPPPRGPIAIVVTLPGLLTLLFSFVLLIAVSHCHGYQRGERSARGEMDATALDRGHALEKQVPDPDGGAGDKIAAPKVTWYGVLVVTYNEGQADLARATTETLRDRYGLTGFHTYTNPRSGKIEVMVGASKSARDPKLKDLEIKLRNIDDYPAGAKRPFMTAQIQAHRRDPTEKAGP